MDYFTLIQDYLEGRLSENIKKDFEDELKRNPELKKTVDIHKGTDVVYDALLEDNISAEIHKYNTTDQSNHLPAKHPVSTNSHGIFKAIRVAAAVLVLAIASAGLYVSQIYSDSAFMKRYTDLPNLSGNRSTQENGHWYDLARLQFEEGQFDQCIAILATVSSDDPDYSSSRFLLAYSLFSSGKYSEANKVFEEIIVPKQPGYQRAQFHGILSDIGAGHYREAMTSLDTLIADPSHPYHPEAIKLHEELRSNSRKILVFFGIQ